MSSRAGFFLCLAALASAASASSSNGGGGGGIYKYNYMYGSQSSYSGGGGDTCTEHVVEKCSEPGSDWQQGPCNSVYGGFLGNTDNLHRVMLAHFQDSFKYLAMGSYFSSAEVNRMGMHKMLWSLSDAAWDRAKSTMGYILKRGGRMGSDFRVADASRPADSDGEVEALGAVLDGAKDRAEDAARAHKHAMNKKLHDPALANLDSYDPDVQHFLQEELLEPLTSEVRYLSGQLNLLAKMARQDSSRAMGLYLFDQSLLRE